VKQLSGGNQQKVVISKWLAAKSTVMIFDEPTRGIDVGAKMEIYSLIDNLATQGNSILMISSELSEVVGMSDRIYIMKDGYIIDHYKRGEKTEEEIGKLMVLGKLC
jgi:ABC-type sugar transport system ATPase subunit